MGEFTMPQVTLEFALTQPAAIVEYCKQLMDSVKMLERQVQGLVRDDRASKSAEKNRKEKQWQLERERLLLDLEVANHGLLEKEESLNKLEKDFQIAKSAAGQLQSKLHESERKRERDLLENDRLKGAIEDAQHTIDELQKSCSLKDDAAAIHRKAFSDLSKRMDSHKKELEKTTEELRQKEGLLGELELENESTRKKLEEKNKFFDSLKQDYDKLRLAHKGMQSEGMMDREDVLRNLEENEALCEEQACTIRKLEKELRKMKSQAKQMEAKCSSAEAEVNAKSALLSKALADLEASSLSVTELASAKEEAVVLAEKMVEFEKELAQERTLRDSMERALQDFTIRESHLLKVEDNFNDLLEKVKWKDEQFGSLEEAHRKLQIQLKVSESEWDNERTQMVREIDSLRDGLESKAKLAQHLNSQLDMLQQALDHEHLHQTDLERGMADAKASMNLAEKEFEKARLAFDIVREELAAKVTLLDEYAAGMEGEPTGFGSWQKDTVQDDGTLECLHSDLRGARTSMERQEPLNTSADVQKNPDSTELTTKFNTTKIAWDEEKERVRRFVRDAEICLACKDVRLKELGVEVGESRSLINALSDLEAKSCVSGLNKLNISNSKNPGESLKGQDTVLRSLKNKRREINMPLQIEQVNQNQEVLVAQEASMLEIERLKEQVSQMIDLHAQKQNLIKQRDLDLKKLQAAYEKALAQLRSNEKTWHNEKDKLISELDAYECKELENERQKKETQTDVERLRDVISKLEVQISSMKQDIVDQSLRAELAKDHLSTERSEVERLKAEAHLLSESFAASMAAKDATLEQLRQRVLELDDVCAGHKEAVNRETLHSKSVEGQLKTKQELQHVLEHRICDLKIELDKSTKETERLSQVELSLLNRIHRLEDESKLMKGAHEVQLESLNAQLSRCQDNLHEVAEELERMSTERDALVSNLSSMEGEKAELRKETQALLRDKLLLESTSKVFEAKQLELVKELEVSKTTMAKLCATHEEAEAGLASKSEELQEMNWKLSNVNTLKLHLQIAHEKNQEMEEILSGTRATVEEKEERLAASEWAVQQLASEIAKAKYSLKQKEREESFLQARLSDLEIHLRDKEREMEEMEMYLNAIMQSNEEKQADIDTLTLKMRDLMKGADEWKLREIDLETELYDLRNSLEESEEALEKIKAEVQLGLEERKSMEDAIDSLKKQLSDKGLGCSDRQFEMDQLCHDLESAHEAATQSSSQLQDLQQRLPQLEQSCADRIRKEKSEFDEVVQELLTIQIKLQNCEVNLEAARADLSQYKEKCDSLVEAVVKKDSIIEALKGKLASAQDDMAHQTTLVEQASRDRLRALQDLDNKIEILKKLEVSAAKTDSTLGNMELNKEKLEQEVKRLKKSLENLRKESASYAHEAERYKSKVEELQEITDQYSDAQVLISQLTNELQVTSSTVEERDSRLFKFQASLISLQDELRITQDMLVEKECHREHLDVQLTMMKSQMEENEAEILQMQEALQRAQSELQTAGESALRYAQDSKNLQAELDVSKAQVASLTEEGINSKLETESSLKELQLEVSVWMERTENLTGKNVELDSAMQKLQCELERWEESADVAACEGRTARDQIGAAVNGLYKQLEDFCQHSVFVEGEGVDKFAELEARLLMAFEELKRQYMSKEVASAKKVELLSSTVKLLFVGLRGWRNELRNTVENDQLARKELYISISDLKSEVELWKSRATAAEDAVEDVRVEFADLVKELQKEVDLWKSRTENCNTTKCDLERSVECLQRELAEWKDKTVAAVDEEKRIKMTHEANLVELQQELEVWKGKVDSVVEELNHQKVAYATSLNDIQAELKDWMNKASTANLEAEKSATEVKLNQGKAAAAAEEMKQVQSQLQQALSTVADLKLQLEHEKNKVTSTEMVTQQLRHDLTIAQEEATFRKAKMSHILSQLESAHASQKSLQTLLRMQHERLLQDNDLASSIGACPEVNHRDLASTLQDLSLKDMVIQDLRSELSVFKSAITRLESERIGSETMTQSAELLLTQDQQSKSGARKTYFRFDNKAPADFEVLHRSEEIFASSWMGLGDVQLDDLHTSGSHSHRAGNSTLLSPIHSPKAPTTRRRNVSPQVHVSKSATRISFTDSSSCNVLSEANENSLAYGPRSSATLTTLRKSRDNQSAPFMGSLL